MKRGAKQNEPKRLWSTVGTRYNCEKVVGVCPRDVNISQKHIMTQHIDIHSPSLHLMIILR